MSRRSKNIAFKVMPNGNIVKRNLNDVVNCTHTNAGSGYKTMEILIVEVEDE